MPCEQRKDLFHHPLLEEAPARTAAQQREWEDHLALARQARDLCAACPVWAECLRAAASGREPLGFLAGTTRYDRAWIRGELGLTGPDQTASDPGPQRVLAEKRRHPEAGSGELAVRLGCSRSTITRHLARARQSTGQEDAAAVSRRPTPDELLDAYDRLQRKRAAEWGLPAGVRRPAATTASPQDGAPRSGAGPRVTVTRRKSGSVPRPPARAPGSPSRIITFSPQNPSLAVHEAVLRPLADAAVPLLNGIEQLTMMLAVIPGSGLRTDTVEGVRAGRELITGLLPGFEVSADSGAEVAGAVPREPATSDPVTVLRETLLDPLVTAVLDPLEKITAVVSMLATVPGGMVTEAAPEQLRELCGNVGRLRAAPTDARRMSGANLQAPGARTSIRKEVEQTALAFTMPFTVHDVVAGLGPRPAADAARDLPKVVSNVLSVLARSGRLRRISRGVYTAESAEAPEMPEAGPGRGAGLLKAV